MFLEMMAQCWSRLNPASEETLGMIWVIRIDRAEKIVVVAVVRRGA